jgi:hypothetical protein
LNDLLHSAQENETKEIGKSVIDSIKLNQIKSQKKNIFLYNMKLYEQKEHCTVPSNHLSSSINNKSLCISTNSSDEFINSCKRKRYASDFETYIFLRYNANLCVYISILLDYLCL